MKIYMKLFRLIVSLVLIVGALSVPAFAAQTKVMPPAEGRVKLSDFGFCMIDANDVFWAYAVETKNSKSRVCKIAENVKEFSEVNSEDYYYLKNDGTVWYVDIECSADKSTGIVM